MAGVFCWANMPNQDTTSQIVNDLAPPGIPHWFSVWALRAIVAVIGLGAPLFMSAVYSVATKQLAAQQSQAIQLMKIGEQMEAVQSTTANNAAAVAHLRADISDVKLELTRIEATGILPLAEKRINELQTSVKVIESKLTKVTPAEIKEELEQSVKVIVERLDKLESR